MVRVMPTETEETKAQTASSIIAPQQETIVLTACMRSKDVREDVLPMLLEDDFVKSDHRALFRAIRAMHEANYPIDDVSLLDYLRSNREMDAAGGEQAVERMFESDMPLLSWQTAYDELIDASRRRLLVTAMNEIEAEAYETPTDMKAFVSRVEGSIAQVAQRRDMRPYRHISSFLTAAVDEARNLDSVPLDSTVVNTGFATLDEMLAGLRAGQLIVVGARPAVGKTSFALTLALNAARQGVKVGIFSLEMSGRELAQRIICAESGVSISHFRMGTIPKASWDAIAAACCDIPGNGIEIEDTVLFLSRDPDEIQDEKSGSRQVILSVAKNRSGPTGEIDMLFVPTSTKFYEVGPRKETRDE